MRKTLKRVSYKQLIAFVVCIVVACVSCKGRVNYQELTDYINNPDNGLCQIKTVNDITCKVNYHPSEFMIWQELGGIFPVDLVMERLQNKYNRQLYFKLSFTYNSADILTQTTNRNVYGKLVNRLSFGMGQYVSLITNNKDTLDLLDSHFLRLYELAQHNEVLLVFDKEKLDRKTTEWVRLDVNDLGFGTGQLNYKFNMNSIEDIPQLNYLELRR